MKKFWLYLAYLCTLCAPVLTSCIDENYDLSNLDKQYRVNVNDLVVPVNLKEITLKNVLDIDEDSSIKEVDGIYAITQSGEVNSDPISIAEVKVPAQYIRPTTLEIYKFEGSPWLPPVVSPGEQVVHYKITPAPTSFSYTQPDVSPDILALEKAKVSWSVNVNMKISDSNKLFSSISFHDVRLKFPSGLTIPGYSQEGNYIKIPDFTLSSATSSDIIYSLTIPVSEVDFTKMPTDEYSFITNSDGSHSLKFNGEVGVFDGEVIVTTSASFANVPSSVIFNFTPVMTDIEITSFTGNITYNLDNFEAPTVSLNDLPDILTEPETNIILSNPQLYLSLNNPVGNFGLKASTGLTLTAIRENPLPFSLDPGQKILIEADKGIAGPYQFCISPAIPPRGYYSGFENATHVGFTEFSNVLSGSGVPNNIKVSFDKPCIMPGHVTDFKLGQQSSIPGIHGEYLLYCPLSFNTGSKIEYSDIADGWYSDTMEKLTVTSMKVKTTVTSDLPFDVKLGGTVMTLEGKPCIDPNTGKEVTLTKVTIPSGKPTEIELGITGVVTNLDGIRFSATAQVEKDGETLKPTLGLTLKDIRVTVGGYYQDKF